MFFYFLFFFHFLAAVRKCKLNLVFCEKLTQVAIFSNKLDRVVAADGEGLLAAER